MFGLEEISSKVVQWDRMEQLAGGGNQTSFKKKSYMTKLIFWEFGYLINLLKGNFFLKIYIVLIQTKLRNVYVQDRTSHHTK